MSKTNKILLVLVVLLLIVLIGIVIWQTLLGGRPYYAVLLRTGDLYFGQLTRFPSFGLKNVYLLQVNPQNQQNPISIQRFTNIFWGPEDRLKLNREEVIWIAKLNPQGQLAQVIRTNPDLLPQGAAVGQPAAPAPAAPAAPQEVPEGQ